MIHEKTIVYFTSKNDKYEVEYFYREGKYGSEQLHASVKVNGNVMKEFKSFPTKTNNPSKSQAKELIALALKENKKKTRSVIIEKIK